MQGQTMDSGIASQWWKLGGIAGVLWALSVLVGGVILQGEAPTRSDSAEEIRQYFIDDGDIYLLGDAIVGLAFMFFFFPYIVTLSHLLRPADGRPPILANLFVIGAIIAALWGGLASVFWGALALGVAENPDVSDATIMTLMELDAYGFAGMSIAIALFIGAGSLAILQTGALWRWLAGIGAIVVVLMVIGSFWPVDGDEEGALAIFGFIAFPLTLLWVIASSVGMIMRSEPTQASS